MAFKLKFLLCVLVASCTVACQSSVSSIEQQASPLVLESHWIMEAQGEVMLDPQTSGLTLWRENKLVTIADGSAHESQVLKLIVLDPQRKQVTEKLPITVAQSIAESCFGEYMLSRPDLEALVVDPQDDSVFYSVTEDASYYPLSEACAEQYQGSGSTPYPTLLVRLQLNETASAVTMTDVRPIQYSAEMQVGNHPNDGIEGITFGADRTLYLALEKDANYQPRIFSVQMNEEFWQEKHFAAVKDEKLDLPRFNDQIPHPINALSWFDNNKQAWIIAAARNDNELWLVDPKNELPTKRIKLEFVAETGVSTGQCAAFEKMDNYSIEGVAAGDGVLWLVNDPWKQNYKKNIQCATNKSRYEQMAPLLSQISLQSLVPVN